MGHPLAFAARAVIVGGIDGRKRGDTDIAVPGEQLENLLGEAPIGMYLVDADFRVRAANPIARAGFADRPGLIGEDFEQTIRAVRNAADADEVIRLFRHTLRTGEACVKADYRAERHDGVIEHYDWQIHRITLAEGGLGVACYFRDNSAEVRTRDGIVAAQQQLRASEMRYRRLFETAHDGILLLDAESARITDANPFITKLLGYTHADLVGKELWQIGLFADIAESKAAMQELQLKHFIRYENLPLQTKAGLKVELEFVSNVYSEGQHQVIQCNIRDVTVRKLLEGEQRHHSADLMESGRRKDEFLAMLAHELRNPLAPIRNALQIMRLSAGDEAAVRSAATMMERQVGQMVRLVDDLLDASRVSRGTIELRKEWIELSSAIYHAIEAARPLADSLKHVLEVTMPAEPIWLSADSSRLAQIIGNLLNNACKFTDAGGRIGLTVELEPGRVVIRVRDNGIGLSTEQLPQIFDMFMQADTSLGRSVSGLGIGLTLVKNLVEIHGGTLEVHSAGIGEGSEFVVRLPITTSEMHEPPPPPPAMQRPTAGSHLRRILVVDDNRDSATSLAHLLGLMGFQTLIAYDGLEAMTAALTFRPHAALLDIGLPKLNGFGVARQIRAQPWGKEIVLVALTGWGQDQDRDKSREAGFDHHLVKPVDLDALLGLLAELPLETVAS